MVERKTLDVNEMAQLLGVSRGTVYELVRLNEIPYFRLRKRILFGKDAIDIWINKQQTS